MFGPICCRAFVHIQIAIRTMIKVPEVKNYLNQARDLARVFIFCVSFLAIVEACLPVNKSVEKLKEMHTMKTKTRFCKNVVRWQPKKKPENVTS